MIHKRLVCAAAVLFVVAAGGGAQASLLVDEGFSSSVTYTSGTSISGLNGGTGFATGTSGNWALSASGTQPTPTAVAVAGLSLGPDYVTHGDLAVQISFSIASGQNGYVQRQLGVGSTSSEIWTSVLFKVNNGTDANYRATSIEFNSSSPLLAVVHNSNGAAGHGAALVYNAAVIDAGPNRIDDGNNVYLLIQRVTGLGTATTIGQYWALTAGEYTTLKGLGFTPTNLSGNCWQTASATYSGSTLPLLASPPDSLLIRGRGTVTWTEDEIRIGESALDIGLPEPATLALLGVGAGLSVIRHRRRRGDGGNSGQ